MWKKRSVLEKSLLILVATLMFVIIVLALLLVVAETRDATEADSCLTENCIRIASNVLQAMDTSVNPCEDFYSYACNGWIKANPNPEGKSTWETFMKLKRKNEFVLKRALEKPIESFKSEAEQKAKLYYESCLDATDTIEELGAKPMIDLINKIGGWNVSSSNFDVSTWKLHDILQILHNEYNIAALFSYVVGEDDRNSSRHIIQIDQSGLTLPKRENYMNKTEHAKILTAYLEYMTKVGILLGGEPNSTQAQMQAVIDFETRLATITMLNEQRQDEETLYHVMSISELQNLSGFIDWQTFFEDAFKLVDKQVTNKENVMVHAPEYLKKLAVLVTEYDSSTEGKIILNNYFIWQTVKTFTGYLCKAFRDAHKGLKKIVLGSKREEPQWRYCIDDTNNAMGFATGAIFVKEVFQKNSKTQAEDIITNVRLAFKSNFKNLNWMDLETRKIAELKVDAMSDVIGYPQFILNQHQLDDHYSTLDIRSDAYFENNINLNRYNLRKNLETINEPVNNITWSVFPSTVNAYYTPVKNQIVFPAGILQKPFYDVSYPASLNYGGIGAVVGHELTHGFDDLGREYDKEGNWHHWWNTKTTEKFKERSKCVMQQYNKYEVIGKNVNGNLTLGENIADNGGLKMAYHAYLNIAKKQTEPPPLPGLNLTHRQLFFVAFAQVWCTSISDESINLQIQKDAHSPSRIRVLGSLSNLKEFSDAFKCKPGSKMNPKNKCEVW